VTYHEDSENTTFATTNNPRLKQEARQLIIEIVEGLHNDPVTPVKLGCIVVPLDVLDKECLVPEIQTILRRSCRDTEFLRSAAIEIEATRQCVEAKYLKRKRKEAENKLQASVDDVRTFTESESDSCHVNGDIHGRGGLSLLDASIKLRRVDLAETLLGLGANSCGKSKFGSSIELARRVREEQKGILPGTTDTIQRLARSSG